MGEKQIQLPKFNIYAICKIFEVRKWEIYVHIYVAYEVTGIKHVNRNAVQTTTTMNTDNNARTNIDTL